MMLNNNSKVLYNLMWKMPPDYDEIRHIINHNKMTPAEITLAMVQFIKAIRYEEDCSDELSSFIGDDNAFEFSYYEKYHSAFLPGLMQTLIESGLDVNLLSKFGDVLHRILYLENGYTAADTFAVLFNNGLDVYTADDDGDSLFDTIDFDILFGMRNQYIRRRYDSWFHTWLVFVGYGAEMKNGTCPVDIVYEDDENSEFEIKNFEIEDLRNHHNYYFGISYLENRGDKYTIHIFDKRTKYEVARL